MKLLTWNDFPKEQHLYLEKLYEDGFISYPRTNALLLSNEIFENRKKIIENIMLVNRYDNDFIIKICSKINLNHKSHLFSDVYDYPHQPLIPLYNDVFIFNRFSYLSSNIYSEEYDDVYKKIRDNFIKVFIEPN